MQTYNGGGDEIEPSSAHAHALIRLVAVMASRRRALNSAQPHRSSTSRCVDRSTGRPTADAARAPVTSLSDRVPPLEPPQVDRQLTVPHYNEQHLIIVDERQSAVARDSFRGLGLQINFFQKRYRHNRPSNKQLITSGRTRAHPKLIRCTLEGR
ncbi:hypothetical protein EVAR_23332_1 [Eumeta japonica]|uniref:Uncharacterized protein n=1 Tax=Eumeta variegata TaxID=151549 RepID=A0A4C1XW49_EUMVA|nr:hypothetical protein EVAR_23332_1 [Eumeta japonica]